MGNTPLDSTWGAMAQGNQTNNTLADQTANTMAQGAAIQNPGGANPAATAGPIQHNTPFDQGTNAQNGFAAAMGYNPGMLNQNIYQNPWAILPDVFKGINPYGAGYNALRNLGADPLSLFNIMTSNAGPTGATGGNASDYTNWLASLYSTLGTAGGRNFSAPEMLQNIFNPGGLLKSIEHNGDASQQMRTLFNLVKDATNVGLNPLAARGYQGDLSTAGDMAMNQMLKNNANAGPNNVPMYQLIAGMMPNLR